MSQSNKTRLLIRTIPVIAGLLIFVLVAQLVWAVHTATVTNTPPPPVVYEYTETTFTLNVANDAGSTDDIEMVELVVDIDWTVPGTQPAPPLTEWTVAVAGNTITWEDTSPKKESILPGSSLDFSWTATPAGPETSSHGWTTTDDATPTAGTDTGTVTTLVDPPAPEFPFGAALPLAMAAVIYLLMQRKRKKVYEKA